MTAAPQLTWQTIGQPDCGYKQDYRPGTSELQLAPLISESTKSSPGAFLKNAIGGYMARDLVRLQLQDVAMPAWNNRH